MNILAIGSHPDDLEIACGGTIARYAKEGHKVFMCHIANGDLGHKIIKPEELARIRRKEAEDAAAVLGAESVYLGMEVGDSKVEAHDKAVRDKVVEVIRYADADVIITHNPDDYMRDHMQASAISCDASFGCTLPFIIEGSEEMGKFPPVFYMDTLAGIGFIPTEYVDITDEIELKLRALACHKSQIDWMLEHDHIDFIDFVRTCSKYRGLQSNCEYAEGFRQYAGWPRFHAKRLLP